MNIYKNHPIFQTKTVMKVVGEIVPDPQIYIGISLSPIVESETDDVLVDVRKNLGGLTQAIAGREAEPIVVGGAGAAQFHLQPAFFAERRLLTADDFSGKRRLGTVNEQDSAAEMIARISKEMTDRAFNRVEWAVWQAFSGSLTVAENGVNFTVNYPIPSYLKPVLTGTSKWTDAANSDPISDLLDWTTLLSESSGVTAKGIYMNSACFKLLMKNNSIKSKIDSISRGSLVSDKVFVTRETLQKLIQIYVGNVPLTIYDAGYYRKVDLIAAAASGATQITVRNATGFKAGDTIYLKSPDLQTLERATINSISGNVITLSSALANAFPVHSEVAKLERYIPDNKVFIIGEVPPGTEGGQDLANFVSVNAPYGNGTLQNPKPGLFVQAFDKSNDVPPRMEIVGGIFGLPLIYHPTAILSATVA